jgi:hypothetical protein
MTTYTPQQTARFVKAAKDMAAGFSELVNSDLAVGNEDEPAE